MLQEYSYPFTGVLSSNHLDIAGGDARLYDLQLKVVPNPNLNLKLVCEYPSYIERKPSIDRPGQCSGSGARADRFPRNDPRHGQQAAGDGADRLSRGGAVARPGIRQFRGGELGPERNEFTYAFEPFPAPAAKQAKYRRRTPDGKGRVRKPAADAKSPHEYTLQFTLRDTDGFKARDPIFLTLVAVPDEPPEVKVRLVGTREPVVTPKGRLPVTGMITDDQGLGRAWWDYTVEERAAPAIAAKPSADPGQKPAKPPKLPGSDRAKSALLAEVA